MQLIASLMQRARSAGRAVFGELSWQPPGWVANAYSGSRERSGVLIAAIRREPRRAATWAGAVVISLAALGYGWYWWANRPEPAMVAFSVAAPGITCYECTPPGAPQPLTVQFEQSAAPLEALGRPLPAAQDVVTLRPEVRGEWRWLDDKTLRFQPAEDWPIGREFNVKFARRKLAADSVLLKDYDFIFQTPRFGVTITGTEFNQDPVIATNKKVVTSLKFTHPVDPESFEKSIRMRMYERITDTIAKELDAPTYTVVYDKLKMNAYIHSGQLEIPRKSGQLTLAIQPGVRAARPSAGTETELAATTEIPGLNSLKVADLSLDIVRDARNEPDQVLLITTSASVVERELPPKVNAYLLPMEHPDPKLQGPFARDNRGRPFPWSEATLRPEVLTAANRLTLTQIPGERDHYELHSLRYTADPGRYVYIKVDAGLRSFGGYILGDSVERIVAVPEFPRELSILGQGSLVSLSGEKTLSLFARNVPAVRVEIGRVLPRQLQHLITQTSGNFQQPAFENSWQFNENNLTERLVQVDKLPQVAPGKAQYDSVDLGKYLGDDADRRGIFMLQVRAWDAERNTPLDGSSEDWNDARNGTLSDSRLIVVTDLGLLAKRTVDGSNEVFVQSIATGEPVAGATVEVIGRNGLPVLTETTDAEGHVRFADLTSFKRERQPVYLLARRGGDSSFLPLDERGRTLDMSRFEVGGVQSNSDRGSLSAYLFSDRGIYRPGEEIHAAALVRSQDWTRSIAGVPLRLEITDPRGTVIRREVFTPGASGLGEIRHPTRPSSPTGTYTLSLSIVRAQDYGDLIGSVSVQVRDFQPDRLRMRASFSKDAGQGWVAPEELKGQIKLENLFGTPAQQRRVTALLTLSPSFPSFRNFADYQFFDPQYAKEGFNEQLPDLTTDNDGAATIDLNLQRFARATYRVNLVTQGFEADGGRGVTAEAAVMVSNLPYLIGYKADGDLNYLPRDTKRTVDLVAINSQAQRTAVKDLKLARLEIRYVSTLLRQPNGTYKYESRRKETQLDEKPLALTATTNQLQLATDAPGTFAYVVRDGAGQQFARVDYQVAGEGNVARAMEKNAELELVLSKKDFVPGEDVEMSIRAPYAGAGLITIERERVYAWQWFKTSTTSSVQKIKLPQGLEGSAYVSVSFVRDPGSSEIYTSPLSYAVQPFSIDVDARRNDVTLGSPERVKPGEVVKIKYRTERPSRLVLFAVDEGILQVANYQTPDPLSYFFQKRALQVSTTQILDLILPEFRQLALNAAPGGDSEGLLGKHLNPFRRKGEAPVAYWSGIVDADSTERELQYTVPDYFNGTLRVMAVAVSDDQVGVGLGKTVVRGDFVLSPNAPTTVTPGDEFEVSVGVANNLEGSGPNAALTIGLKADNGLEVIGEAKQQVTIGEGRESPVRFRVRTRDVLGAANLSFSAQSRGSSATRRIDLSVRPATPYMTQLSAGVLGKGEREVRMNRTMYPQYRVLQTGISMLPLQFAHGFNSYLSNYPYNCTEQIVSQAMPAVVLSSRPEFGSVSGNGSLAAVIGELRSRQNDAGAYKLWPGSNEVIEFVSLYAQHLLIEAAERREPVPADLLESGNVYLRALAARDGNNLVEERQSAYAIYLLTRQGTRMTAEVAAVRKRLAERYRNEWQQDLAAAYLAASLDMMKQDRDANALIDSMRFAVQGDELYYDPMTRDALLLYLLSRHFPERLGKFSNEVLATLAKRVDEGVYHSLSAGTTLLALDAYATATQGAAANLSIAEVLKDKRVKALALPKELLPKLSFSDQAAALRFGNNSGLNAYYVLEQSGFDRTPPAQAIKQGMEVLREYTDAEGKLLTSIKMGDQVDVHLKFRGLGNNRIASIALVDLLPGGFELVVPQAGATSELAEASNSGSEEESSEGEEGYASEESAESSSGAGGWQCVICAKSNAALDYADLREDRVVFYATASKDVSEIVYRIKATNVGNYVIPPAYGEAMYQRGTVGRSASGRIEVVRP